MTSASRDERRCLLIVSEVMSSPNINTMPASLALALVKSLIVATSPNPEQSERSEL